MKKLVLEIIPALMNVARKKVNCFVILLLAAGFFSCEKSQTFLIDEVDDVAFCSCLNLEDINKTIPIVNKFLAGHLAGILLEYKCGGPFDDERKEQIFKSLKTWLKSFSCNIDAKILYGEIGRASCRERV